MKRLCYAILFMLFSLSVPLAAGAQTEEPTIYVIKQGDTLWGLSDRFIKDPYYWPNLWANNRAITNPHLIFPGQRVRVYSDRIELEDARPQAAKGSAPAAGKAEQPAQQVTPERTFLVSGGEGFLSEKEPRALGHVVASKHDRILAGVDDTIYTDMGKVDGVKVGDRFSVFRRMEEVMHPVTNRQVGYRVASLGALRLTGVEERGSKADIFRSYMEIEPGSILMPYRQGIHEVTLKAATRDLHGYIVATLSGSVSIGNEEIIYLDMGRSQGLEIGNLLYVVRDISPKGEHGSVKEGVSFREVIGAIVVVDTGDNTSTGLVIKSVETIYRGDKVELKKG